VTGSYTPLGTGGTGPTDSTLTVTYAYATPSSQGPVPVEEYDPTLTFSETVTVEAGTGVSLVAALLDPTGSGTCTLKQNGTVIESQQLDSSSSCDIGHTVGQ
jgi:hypothetical protein